MAVKLLFNDIPAFFDSAGDPLNGGKLYTYAAGSSTPQTTYTTSVGDVAQANPIILNSRGEPANAIWGTTGQTYKFVLKTSADVTIWTIDNVSPINDTIAASAGEWISGPTPTYIGATSFSLVGDQTSTFHVGRRIKTTNSGGTIYSTISVTAYTTLTTVTVVNDSGTLDAGLSDVSYSILSAVNFTVPKLTQTNKRLIDLPGLADDNTFTGLLTMSSKSMYWAKGADIASAATLVLGADGNMFDVTGSTGPITAITVPAGMLFMLQFDSTPTLTHHATNLNLPDGADITVAAGDRFICFATAANQVTVMDIQPQAKVAGVVSVSGTSVDFTGIPAWARKITIMLSVISTNGTDDILFQIGHSGGLETTGYNSVTNYSSAGTAAEVSSTAGFIVFISAITDALSGILTLCLVDPSTNTWSIGGSYKLANNIAGSLAADKVISGVLDRIRMTTTSGTDTFDAGKINIRYER